MNRILNTLLLMLIITTGLAAKETIRLLNIGQNFHSSYLGQENLMNQSISFNYTVLHGTKGFYMQLTPYYGQSQVIPGKTINFYNNRELFAGSGFLFGYGKNFDLGSTGILLGGGVLLDTSIYTNGDQGLIEVAAGFGVGTNLYFHPGNGNFVINGGFSFAWKPYHYIHNQVYGTSEFVNMTSTNINFGIGWNL